MSDAKELEEMIRRVVREELQRFEPERQRWTFAKQRGYGMACACGPGQCARANTTAGPCEHMRHGRLFG